MSKGASDLFRSTAYRWINWPSTIIFITLGNYLGIR